MTTVALIPALISGATALIDLLGAASTGDDAPRIDDITIDR